MDIQHAITGDMHIAFDMSPQVTCVLSSTGHYKVHPYCIQYAIRVSVNFYAPWLMFTACYVY